MNNRRPGNLFRVLVALLVIGSTALGTLGKPQKVQAAVASGYSEYFLPGGSDQLMEILEDNDTSGAGTQLTNIITISVAVNNVKIYYDQWENGYGTGITGADEIYTANKGTVLTFKSTTIPYPRGNGFGACTGSTFPAGATLVGPNAGTAQANRCYDGRDRLYVVGGAVAVAQAFWPTTNNTNYANAWEVYPIKPYQTNYTIPVGEDMCLGGTNATTPPYIGSPTCGGGANSPYADFDDVYVLVQATNDGTNVTITSPAGGNLALKTKTVNGMVRGDVTDLRHINSGTTIVANNPVQVQFIIGEDHVNNGQNNSRSYTAVPSTLWSNQYFSPVPGFSTTTWGTDIYIYNPTASPLMINYVDSTGSGSFSVAAHATEAYHDAGNANRFIPQNSAVYLAAADGVTKFWAIGGVDVGSPTYNWGFSLIPPQTLTNEYFVSWAPGGWTQATGLPYQSNASPIYVTPTHDGTTVFVDYSPADGTVDATYTLNRFHMQRIYDQTAGSHTGDADNTGMHIWANYPIALVYGEDAGVSNAASPGLDAGYTILPLNADWMDVVETVNKTANPSTIQTAIGQVVTFDIETNINYPLSRVDVTDDLPTNWVYDAGTTKIYLDGAQVSTTEPSPAGQHPAWNNVIPGGMNAGQKVTVEFHAHNTAVLTPGVIINTGTSTGTSPTGEIFTGEGTADVNVLGSLDLIAEKTNNTGGSAFVGTPFIWTLTVTNQGTGTAANFANGNTLLTDNLPAGATYTAGAVTKIGATTGTINCTVTAVAPFDLTCTAGTAVSIPANGGGFSVPLTVTPAAAGMLTNPRGGAGNPTCMVDPLNSVNTEADENNNTCSDSVTVTTSPSHIGDFVWNDANGNGIQDGGETGINGVTVNLRDSTGASILQTTTTNASGAYSFTTGAGIYLLEFVKPTGYTASPQDLGGNDATDSDASATTGRTGQISLAAGATDNTQDAGFYQTVTIGDFVWNDSNANGIQDGGETGITGVTVNLRDSSGATVLQTATTNASGLYSFTAIAGTYIVEFVKPAGYSASPQNQGGNDAVDSDASVATGRTSTITAAAGTTDNTQDAGFYPANASISGQVRYDTDNDGVLADSESGLAGASVALWTDPNGDGDPADGVQVGSTVTTTGTGAYSFTNLGPGNYVVVETNPAGYVSTNDSTAPNDDRNPVTLAVSATSTGHDFLDTNVGTIFGQVRYDADNDGVLADPESGLAGASVALWTDPNGDGNPADGVQVGASVTTTGAGVYGFTNVVPGNYVVVETNPSGYVSTNDSAAPNNDRIPVTLGNSGASINNDFLDTNVADISGQVRYDADNDGVLADPESGLAGAAVSLWTDPNGDGNPADGAPVGGTVTTGSGGYLFANMAPGDYVVVEINPAGYTSTNDKDGNSSNTRDQVAVTLLPSTNNGGNDFLDTNVGTISGQVRYDLDNDGILADPESGLAGASVALWTDPNGDGNPVDGVQVGVAVTTAGTGLYSFTNVAPDNYVVVETNPSGYTSTNDSSAPNNDRIPVILAGSGTSLGNDFLDTNVASISGQVRNDTDSDGNPADVDAPITGVTIDLYADDGTGKPTGISQANTTTDAGGSYTFTNVVPGNYVVVETNPGSFLSTYDKDGSANNSLDQIAVVLLPSTNNSGNDFLDSNVGSISGQVRYDVDNNGILADPESGLAGASVALWTDPNGDGNPVDGTQVGSSLTTSGSGNYQFTSLLPGDYVVVETNPSGYVSTNDTASPNDDRIAVSLTAGIPSSGNDFLDTNVGSISGQVRYDIDNDGILADAESGLTGAGIALWTDPNGDGNPADGIQVGSTFTTLATGLYTFTNVAPGNYVVVESNPAGYTSTNDSAGPNNDRVPVALGNSGTSTGNDFLDTNVGSISGQVRYDIDNDGVLADVESGLAGAGVALWTDPNGDGNPADGVQVGATVTTTGTGLYSFTNVVPGNYVVTETNPAGYTSTADSAAPNNDRIPVTLAASATSTGNDFLDTNVGSISGQVRYDADNDGILADVESGLAGANVALWTDPNGDGNPADGAQVGASVTTTGTGLYSFTNVVPGDYVVVEINPAGYASTADSAAPNDDLIPVTLGNSGNSTGNDFLDTNVGSISGQVRSDADNDGVLADVESGLAGASVALWTDPNGDGNPADGVQVGSPVTTTGTGLYGFTNVVPGNYVVVETNPVGYVSTADSAAPNDDRIPVTLGNGATSTGNDFLDTNVAAISGQVRYDVDNDGVLADAESGLSGAGVALWTDPNGDGDPADGTQVGSTITTTGTGSFSFLNVVPGDYVVVETNPAGYTSTNDKDGSADNTLDQVGVTLLPSTNNGGNDFLDTNVGSISGQVRYDADNDGVLADVESGLAGASVTLWTDPNGDGNPADGVQVGPGITTTTTGLYTFTNVIPGNYVVVEANPTGYMSTADIAGSNDDRIAVTLGNSGTSTGNDFLDTNLGSISGQVRYDVDNNGALADAESGLAGASVALWTDPNGDGNPADGIQIGSTVLTSGTGLYSFTNLTPGNYVVVETNPAGYTSTADSAAPNNDRIPVALGNSGTSTGNDFLDTNVGSISGQVRYDVDKDGVLADAESGLAGASVALWTDPNGDGNPADGIQVGSSVTTTATGLYNFTNVLPGNYVVMETNPAGYTSTNDISAPNDDTIPLILPASGVSTGNDFLDTNVANISGQVRNDANNNGNPADADAGINGVTIALFADDGTGQPIGPVLRTTTTSGTGTYSFLNVTPGNYVVVETNPTYFTSTYDKDGSTNNTLDQIAVVLLPSTNNGGNDFLDNQQMPAITVTKDASPTSVPETGGTVTFTYTVQNSGPVPVTITSLGDDVFGALAGDTDCHVGTALVPGASCNFTVDHVLSGTTGSTHTNIFTAHVQDGDGNDASNTDSATVTFTDVLPTFSVTKDAAPTSVPATGGDVTFTYTVTNTGSVPVQITSLDDDVFGALSGDADCNVGTILAPAGTCNFAAVHHLSGPAGTTHTDIFTAHVTDTDGHDLSAADNASVGFDVVLADFKVVKSNAVTSLYVGGTTVYTIRVTNQGPNSVTGAIFTDAAVAGLNKTATACSATPGQCVKAPTVSELESGLFALPKLDAGQFYEVTVTADVTATSGTVTNRASVSLPSDFTDPTPLNNADADADPVGTGADLEISKTDGVGSIKAGETTVYTIRVTNHGPSSVSGALLNDSAISGLTKTAVACSTTPGQCVTAPSVAELESGTFVLPTLANGQFYEILVNATVTATSGSLTNIATVTLPTGIDDPTPANNSGTDVDPIATPAAPSIPATGFAPDRVTPIPEQTAAQAYDAMGNFWLEIPALGIQMPIVGVPQLGGTWDVSWLGKQAGWLNGTAYPTSKGNSVITGHVTLPNGKAGPFVYLRTLSWGNQIIIHAPDGQRYVYEVREVERVLPNDSSAFQHEELSWLTLITCQGYNATTNSYTYRTVVRAVLISVKPDLSYIPK